MSNSLLQKFAAMLQETSAPVEQKPITKGSAFLLIKLLNSKEFKMTESVKINGKPLMADDGDQITYGDLKFREEDAERPDGSFGPHYPNVWALAQTEASAAIDWLQSQPAKASNGNYRRNGGKKSQSDSSEMTGAEVLAALRQAAQADPAALAALLGADVQPEPAKPVPAAGHRQVRRLAAVPVPEGPLRQSAIEINVGDIVSIGGQLRQVVSTDGGKTFRLNKSF